jgi:TRAP transporter TAXI family solute receptor
MMLTRRTLLRASAATAVTAGAGLLSACGDEAAATAKRSKAWHDGRLYIATGNTTGVFYQIGGGYADLITRFVPGYEAHAESSGASGDNIKRVATGDFDIGFTNGDTAADAIAGNAPFKGQPQKIMALSRIYRNYVHCVVRTAAGINTFADLRGKRVSTSSPNSGTDILAGRILEAGNLNPDRDVVRQRLSLPETTAGMQAGTTDALFFTGGLPTPGITDLMASGPTLYRFLPLDAEELTLTGKYGSVYGIAPLPKTVYGVAADTLTIVVVNMIVVSSDLPEALGYQLTKVLFEHQADLAKVHREGGNFDKTNGANTEPVPLHPGARRYFSNG